MTTTATARAVLDADWDIATFEYETRLACSVVEQARVRRDDGRTLLVVCANLDAPKPVVEKLIAARRRGDIVAMLPMLTDRLESCVKQLGVQLAKVDLDGKARYLEALKLGKLQHGSVPLAVACEQRSPEQIRGIYAACRLPDVLVFASLAQKCRWERILGRPITRFEILAPREHGFDHAPGDGRDIAVFSPRETRTELAFFDGVFAGRIRQPRFVCAGADAASELAQAAVVIAPQWHTLAAVDQLVRLGKRVVAPFSTGIAEFGLGIGYDPLNSTSLIRAVDEARSNRYAVSPRGATPREAHALPIPPQPPDDGPLVSVIVRTFNRPLELKRALESIDRQTYRAVEIVVVNDAGADVSDVVASFQQRRPLRYVTHPTNFGMEAASNSGIRAASGQFLTLLDDDDIIYPDHIARLAHALERSGAAIAYTNSVAEYATGNGSTLQVEEYAICSDADYDVDRLMTGGLFPVHAAMIRREVFARIGYFDETFESAGDWDFWIRASRFYDFVHCDHATCEYSQRFDPERGNMQTDRPARFLRGFDKIIAKNRDRFEGRTDLAERVAGQRSMLTQWGIDVATQPHRTQELLMPRAMPNP